MSQSFVTLPAPLPADVAALGTPDHVFPPGTGKRPPLASIVMTVLIALAAVICWVGAAIFTGIVVVPGSVPPPPEIGLYAGVPCMLVGTLFLIAAAWHGMGGHIKPQAYLFFKDALVELFPNRHRVIAWEKLGPPTVVDAPLREYWFPVRDGKALHFDYTMPDHDQLASALSRLQLTATLGGEAAVAALTVGTPAPYFLACGGLFTNQAIYRVSLLGPSLLGLRVGEGSTEDPQAETGRYNAGAAAGALGALAVALGTQKRINDYEKFRATMKRVDGADEQELLQFASEFHGSFLIPAADLVELKIDAPSFWQQINQSPDVGRLRLAQTGGGKKCLDIPSHKDLMTANRELAKIRP